MVSAERIAVVGAGIVGVSTAEWLRRDGHDVTLIDRIPPGDPRQTSYGNAGILARASIVPVPVPGILRSVPRLLLSRDGPLFLKWRYLPKLFPWLIPYLRTATPEAVSRIAAGLADILGDTVEQHLALAEGTPAERFIERGHWIYLYRDRAAFEKDAFGFGIRRAHGFDWDEADREALLARDPHLGPEIGFGALLRDHGWIRNPGAYVAALAETFVRGGGRIETGEVADIAPGPRLVVNGEARSFDRVVLAAGVWSRVLAERLGHRIPMETERGYHLMLRGPSHMPAEPMMFASGKFAITPMETGLRCAGLVEFGGTEAPPSDAPLELFRRQIRRIYPDLRWQGEESWMGNRPSTVDSLPLIGESTRAKGVYCAFGAQHVGLTSGPKTGRMIADMIAGRRANIDLTPFAADRFDRA